MARGYSYLVLPEQTVSDAGDLVVYSRDMDSETLGAADLAAALISSDDPPPFELLNPEGGAPVLLICDHASREIPERLDGLGLTPETLDLHVAWDIGAANVTRRLAAKLDARAVLAGYSRLVIDNNRQPGDPTAIPEVTDNIVIPGNQGLSEADEVARRDALYWPYHRAVSDGLAHLWRRGTPPALFSVHSFTPSMGGEDREWHVGVLWNRDPRIAEPLIYELRRRPEGLNVGDNLPYSGADLAHSLDFHGGAAGLPNCAVEIRQDLVDDDEGAEQWAGLLADCLKRILQIDDIHEVKHY